MPFIHGALAFRSIIVNYSGSCKCKRWSIQVSLTEALSNLNPRVCDCDYCQSHPSALISNPRMEIQLLGDSANLVVNTNGDQLASFYLCGSCSELLAVGCAINGELRGAANALLLEQKDSLGNPMPIQPRLLSSAEKLSRWGRLWGTLKGV